MAPLRERVVLLRSMDCERRPPFGVRTPPRLGDLEELKELLNELPSDALRPPPDSAGGRPRESLGRVAGCIAWQYRCAGVWLRQSALRINASIVLAERHGTRVRLQQNCDVLGT
eukprot:6213840-Pleurochrysis_carterae.AAC.1